MDYTSPEEEEGGEKNPRSRAIKSGIRKDGGNSLSTVRFTAKGRGAKDVVRRNHGKMGKAQKMRVLRKYFNQRGSRRKGAPVTRPTEV